MQLMIQQLQDKEAMLAAQREALEDASVIFEPKEHPSPVIQHRPSVLNQTASSIPASSAFVQSPRAIAEQHLPMLMPRASTHGPVLSAAAPTVVQTRPLAGWPTKPYHQDASISRMMPMQQQYFGE